ncbi:MAG: GGDEF domain-containing protein, partial [Pseudohongiellaceae bacterium]
VAQVAGAIRQAATLLKRRRLDLELAQRTNMRELERQVDERTQDLLVLNHKLEQLALADDLTGLQNRKAVYARLRQEFLRLKRSGRGYAVLYLDIDHFKRINDTFGHETGDQVLHELAKVLVASVRESDLVARHGGEEFMIVLQDTDMNGAITLAEKICAAVSSHEFPLVRQVTTSIGVTIAAGKDIGEEDAVRRADAALYQAKAEGRSRVCSRAPD